MQSLFSENVPGHLSKAIPTAVFPVPFDKIWFPLLDGIFCISQRVYYALLYCADSILDLSLSIYRDFLADRGELFHKWLRGWHDSVLCGQHSSQRDQGVLSKVWNAMFFLVRNSVVGRIFDPSAFWRRVLGTTHMHLSSLLRDFDFHPWLSSFCFCEGSYHTISMR